MNGDHPGAGSDRPGAGSDRPGAGPEEPARGESGPDVPGPDAETSGATEVGESEAGAVATAERPAEEKEPGRLKAWGSQVYGWFAEDPLHPDSTKEDHDLRSASFLALTLTLIIVLTGSPAQMPALTPLVALVGLAVPGMARNRWFWVLLLGLFSFSPIARPWLQLDNHNWLQVYWIAAIALSRFASRPDATLRTTARLLVGFAFLFAATWKIIAPEFLTGAFFDFTFGTDRRLGDVAVAFGLQESGLTGSNQRLITGWRSPGTTPVAEAIEFSPIIVQLTPWLAAATVMLEGAVAVTFLAPLREGWRWLRDATVLIFVATTYPLAPVTGFGLLVLAMAVTQSELAPRRRAVLYIGAFIFVSLTSERDVLIDLIEPWFNPE